MADAPPAPPLLLASTSPQRKAILEQLHIPFDVVEPRYEEEWPDVADAVELVREHARGKALSVMKLAEERPVLGVDTAVVLRLTGRDERRSLTNGTGNVTTALAFHPLRPLLAMAEPGRLRAV